MRLGKTNTTDEDMYLTDLINNGVKRLRNLGTMIPAQADVPIINFQAQLPDGFIRFTKNFPIRLFNPGQTANTNGAFITQESTMEVVPNNGHIPVQYLGVATQQVFGGGPSNYCIPIFLNGAFYDGLGGLAIQGLDKADPYITVNVVNGMMYFSTNCTFEYVKISYISSNLDEDGSLLIPAICEDALMAFVLYQYKLNNGEYPPYTINEHKMEWQKGKAHCKAIFNMPDSEQYLFINAKLQSMV